MERLMARKPSDRSRQPPRSATARLIATPAGAGTRASAGVARYHHTMPMRYHGAEVKRRIRAGVSSPLIAR